MHASFRRRSRGEAIEHAGEWDRLAHMAEPADPGDAPLDPEAEAGVRKGAVTAQIEVPLERLLGELVLLDGVLQRREVILALAAADDLAVALGREDVHAERGARIGR